MKRKSERRKHMISMHFTKLFGRFNYDVVFNKEGLTILTGPNGYGKSTILRTIEAMANGVEGLMHFFTLDFFKITTFFEKGDKVTFIRHKDKLVIKALFDEKEMSGEFEKNSFREVFDRRPYYTRIGDNIWVDRRNGRRLAAGEFLQNMNYRKHEYFDDDVLSESLIIILKKLKKLVGDIYFVREQRLIREKTTIDDEQETINVIEELPNKFRDLMRGVLSKYSAIANALDSSYPTRLFENEDRITQEEYNEKIRDMSIKYEKLSKYDLSTMQSSLNFVFKEEDAKALKIYFDDFDEKYKVYEDFIKKLDLYTDIINNRLTFKKIKITRASGISVVDDNTEKILNLKQLSSGEKQEIVLFYDLIFGTNRNVMLLIDEPEISLHITWQKKFMDDLLNIIDYKKIIVIVATHSPQIINNHWERQIDLGELYAEQFDKK